jgi:hypothetical protein
MKTRTDTTIIALLGVLAAAPALAGEPPSPPEQIAAALTAAPEDRRAEARILGYSADGRTVVLREGSNDITCLTDKPGDERFQAVCYHQSLEPFMARGRELRAEGVEDTLAVRHKEIDAGNLVMPKQPATLYNLNGSISGFDPATGTIEGASWLWVIYTPYETPESTGLPTAEQAPGGPWIMRPGTASAHIMIVQPKPAAEGS